jgi:hypothetical protein
MSYSLKFVKNSSKICYLLIEAEKDPKRLSKAPRMKGFVRMLGQIVLFNFVERYLQQLQNGLRLNTIICGFYKLNVDTKHL